MVNLYWIDGKQSGESYYRCILFEVWNLWLVSTWKSSNLQLNNIEGKLDEPFLSSVLGGKDLVLHLDYGLQEAKHLLD